MAVKRYVCRRTISPILIDGDIRKDDWSNVDWTDDFVDIVGDAGPTPRFRTRCKMSWDDEFFYIAAEMEEPHVWATLTEHDSVIFHDNDFEVFIDPDGDSARYFEFEINALNTGWDLYLDRAYRDQGTADNSWEMPGYRSAVKVWGTLNDPTDIDAGWDVELALPWAAFVKGGMPCPPRAGDQWRVNFSRVEWETTVESGEYVKVPNKPEDNWVWSPQGIVDMHQPEHWGIVEFAE